MHVPQRCGAAVVAFCCFSGTGSAPGPAGATEQAFRRVHRKKLQLHEKELATIKQILRERNLPLDRAQLAVQDLASEQGCQP